MKPTTHKIIKNYILGTILCFIIAFHTVTVIHELCGHGLAAVLLGGRIDNVYISWMGGSGYVHADFGSTGITGPETALFEWAGILAALVFGAAAWLVWHRFFRDTIWSGMLLWIIALSSCTSGLGYIVLGLHYGYGDMASTASLLKRRHLCTVSVFAAMAVHAAVMYMLCRPVPYIQRKWLQLPHWWQHMITALLVMGAGAGTSAVLNYAESCFCKNEMHTCIMRTEAVRRAEEVADTRNVQRESHGLEPMTDTEKESLVNSQAEEYSPWAVYWIYFPLLLCAAALGIRRGNERSPELQRPSRIPFWLWVLAAASITACPLLSAL